ncbi:hypothetical protein E1A91_D13G202800v1 [Gossypium mustelinum]|uniref:Uncharacterized protein n=1 Tax=Gossypium mustelinum TaxID=34275 RepID=A0A5D2S7W5_GOSMU|nr:hypothetical protein E1A91_D13G202800v1 [Gossypium mustelinum]
MTLSNLCTKQLWMLSAPSNANAYLREAKRIEKYFKEDFCEERIVITEERRLIYNGGSSSQSLSSEQSELQEEKVGCRLTEEKKISDEDAMGVNSIDFHLQSKSWHLVFFIFRLGAVCFNHTAACLLLFCV